MWRFRRGILTQAGSLYVPVGGGNSPGGGGGDSPGGDSPGGDSPGGDSPGAFEWPDETNTGAILGGLTAYSGSTTISGSNVTIEDKTITDSLRVTGANFICRNCLIDHNDTWGIDAEDAVNALFEDCTFIGAGVSGTSNSAILAGLGVIIQRCNISDYENGVVLQSGEATVTFNYIHDLNAAGADPHFDGISVQGAQDGVLIEDNWVEARDTSCVFIKNDFGPINDVTVNHNYLTGNPGYGIYVDGRAAGGPITNVTLSNNVLDVAAFGSGPFSIDDASPTITGNVDPNGDPVP